MYRVVLAIVLMAGCVSQQDNTPSADEVAQADQWAETSDGKADLPGEFGELVAWVRSFYRNQLSAVWANQEHPGSSAAAILRVRGLLAAGGIADPSHVLFKTTVQRLRFSEVADHSEINIVLPTKQVVRLIGDPKGAGMFLDKAKFQTSLAPALCLTWDEVQTAITTSYAPGLYGADFVCHNITERVLRSLKVGSSKFTSQIHAFSIARFVWGPSVPSFNPQDPSQWDESRACQ